jgi:hypothetical protein
VCARVSPALDSDVVVAHKEQPDPDQRLQGSGDITARSGVAVAKLLCDPLLVQTVLKHPQESGSHSTLVFSTRLSQSVLPDI